MFSIINLFVIISFPLILCVGAVNDWSVPCFHGVCSYDLLPQGSGAGSGSLGISGSVHAISDITAAGGWMILDCDPNALVQDVRLVCQNEDPSEVGCDHLFKVIGAVGKIVRLPESCGRNAFARVANASIAEDQSIPPAIAARLVRRADVQPIVHSLSLDTNFGAIDANKTGKVSVSILGSNVPGLGATVSSKRWTRLTRRSLFGSVQKGIRTVASSLDSFNVNQTTPLPPITLQKSFPLFNEAITCSGKSLSVKGDVDVNTNATIRIGVAASGTIVPPNLSEFVLFAGLDATIDSVLNIEANAAATISTGQLTLFEVGIPGLDFPGVLTVGPSFKVNAVASATVDVDVNLIVGLNYNVTNAELFFPPSNSLPPSNGTFSPGSTPLNLSVSPSVATTGTIAMHLIPTIDLGLDVLDGFASATVFLDLDASATAQLSLTAATTPNSTLTPRLSEHNTHPACADAVATPPSLTGCIDVSSGFDVNAGAESGLLGLFDANTKVTLFSQKFDLFNKCLGGTVKRSIRGHRRDTNHRLSKRATLTCPAPGVGAAVSVVDQLV